MNTVQAVAHFGSKRELSKVLGVGRSAVSNWGESIPIARQYQLQIITKGKLKADQLDNKK